MKKMLVLEGSSRDLETVQEILRSHGYPAGEVGEIAGKEREVSGRQELYHKDIFENAPVGIFRSTMEGELIRVNPALAAMLKYDSPQEMIRLQKDSILPEAILREPAGENLRPENGWRVFVQGLPCKGGEAIPCNLFLRIVSNEMGALELDGFVEDLTERKRDEKRIRDSLAEKEVLLREIHHRVKNNLQVVSSLLFLQAQKIDDPVLAEHFIESQNRIYSMALAHDLLYQSKDLADIHVPTYVRSLVGRIRQGFQQEAVSMKCRIKVDDIKMDIDQIIPCGLLITELFSNALKHAFPDGRSGMVGLFLEQKDGTLDLTIEDDGVGLREDLDFSTAESLGLQMARALTLQLNGTIEHEKGNGTRVRVLFPFKPG